MANPELIAKLMGVMNCSFPNYKLDRETILVYSRILKDIPDEVMEPATDAILSRPGAFFPSVGDWRAAALDLMTHTSDIPSAYEAWENAIGEINRCGDYYRYQINPRRPEYKHPLVERAVEIMGYQTLLESDNLVADRAHFFKIYESLERRAQQDARMLPDVRKFTDAYEPIESETGKAMMRLIGRMGGV